MCAKYSAEWWQQFAAITGEFLEKNKEEPKLAPDQDQSLDANRRSRAPRDQSSNSGILETSFQGRQ